MQFRIMLMPCMQPVNTAENNTEHAAFLPLKITNAKAAAAAAVKITPEQSTGLLNFLRYRMDAA